jgi:regulator of sigma E protease
MRGKALPERFLMVAQSVGMMLVFGLMCVAVFNDLMRQFA